ncbi:MAG TPA: response regulator [Mycobacteriales bacterium]|jgi:CheY-like chemotaxis protein
MNGSRRVVLVVDDEAITREVVTAMLELEDVEVHSASSGEDALAKAADVRPDLVLLDVMMPGLDGFEVCRRLTAEPAPPTIVMLTAKADDESRRVAAAAGASAYLVKPFSARDLFKVVEGAA